MRQFFSVLSLMIFTFYLHAQTYSIKGSVQDTLNNPLIGAGVMLLETDSTLLEFTQSELDGSFKFDKLPAKTYLVKVTYDGYIPETNPVSLEGKNVDLGTIKLTEIARELMEVVIKAARAPMRMRGDTLEYDATTFKVPEGSTLEDLLKRLPGVEVAQDGSIKADGKDVTKLTVEGKSFFGNDPTVATKNLPAEGVSKVQVFDNKTEEAKITGDKTPTADKAMNITLKDDYKKGGFGKLVVGAGTKDTKEAKGIFNRFDTKNQFSLVGIGNNTGRNGLNWDDYQDFMGAQSWNGDNLDYGFGSFGGFRYYTYGGGGNSALEDNISSAFWSSSSGGLPRAGSGGINYNYEHNKTKFGSRYFFNHNANNRTTTSNTINYFDSLTVENNRVTGFEDRFNGHRAELSFEKEIDSFNTVVITGNLTSASSRNKTISSNENLTNRSRLASETQGGSYKNYDGALGGITGVYRKSFRKKGKLFAVNFAFQHVDVEELTNIRNDIYYYNENQGQDSTVALRQDNQNNAVKNTFKGNALFNQPLSNKFSLSFFYNYNQRIQDGNITVTDDTESGDLINDNLSRNYENTIRLNRAGTTFSYSFEGVNASLGLGYQELGMQSNFRSVISEAQRGAVDKSYGNVLPFLSFGYQMGRNGNINFSVSRPVREPNLNDMIPLVDNRNPLFITEGNPDLKPITSKAFNVNIYKTWPAQGMRVSGGVNGNFYDNQIVNATTINAVTSATYSTKLNYNGGKDLNLYAYFTFPIVKNKLKVNLNNSFYFNHTFMFINNDLNKAEIFNVRPNMSIDVTPNEKIGLYINGSWSRNETNYDISTSRDQVIYSKNIGVEFNTTFGKGFYLSSNYRHSFYTSDQFGGTTDVPIVNASIYKQFLSGKKGELRLSVYDLFNRNIQFSQSAGGNFVSQTITNALARYFMLTFTYNIKGMTAKLQRDNY